MAVAGDITAEVSDYAHGRVPRALRERQVLAEAEDLFAEVGYTGTSMDELARRVGVSKPVIYALIGSKEELYRLCVERQAEKLAACITAATASETEPAAQLRAGSLAFFGFVGEHRRLWEALASEAGPFAAEAAGIRQRQDDLVAMLLKRAAASLGVSPPALRLSAAAHAINGANEALARWWRDHDELSPEQLTSWSLDLLLPGLEQLPTGSPARQRG
jgi:AcrR family transcriptional regulator